MRIILVVRKRLLLAGFVYIFFRLAGDKTNNFIYLQA